MNRCRVDYLSNYRLAVQYEVVKNNEDSQHYMAKITLINLGKFTVQGARWALFLFHGRLIEPEYHPYPEGLMLDDVGMRLFHVGGYLYKLEPEPWKFKSIPPGGKMEIVLMQRPYMVKSRHYIYIYILY